MSQKVRILGVVTGVAAVSAVMTLAVMEGFHWWQDDDSGSAPASEMAGEAPATNPATEQSTTGSEPPPATGGAGQEVIARTPSKLPGAPFAKVLEGTDIDGRLQADSEGNLIMDLAVRDFFDYFLNTVGQVTPEEAIDRMHQLMRDSLPESTVDQAMALLGRYLSYKEAVTSINNQSLSPGRRDDPGYQLRQFRRAMTQLEQLRRERFSPVEVEAFFGAEEAYAEYTLNMLEAQQREDLSPDQRMALVEQARRQLPESLRQTEERLARERERAKKVQEIMAETQSPEAVARKLRELGMEEPHVAEVTDYLKQQEQFDRRYQDYERERRQLLDAGLAPEDLAQQEQQLLERYFDSEQTQTWARLRALD